ncbi:MAG: BMP family ABC transporter substrate-binding protein [Thermoleophilia bacterium]
MRWTKFALVGALTALALTVVVASGFARAQATKMALVADIGGLNDKSFNQAANAGRLKVQAKLGVQTRVYITQSATDRIPNLQTAAQSGYGIVFATGFFMGDPLDKVAPKFPNTKFAGIDVSVASIPSKAPNVRGIQFKEQEAGYLAGYIAGLTVKQQGGPQVVSAIGANTVPPIVRYMGGYRAGAKRANSKVTVILSYANDPTFSDQAKCKETALNQIQQKTQVIFAVAGGCGLGALNAAKEAKLWGIGVDVDQGYLGSYMLTSALKDVAAAVYLTTQEFKKNPGAFKGGFDKVFNVKNGGIGYGKVSTKLKNRAAIIKKTNAIKKLIASGKIKPPAK